jgi:hypothetical protein
VEHEARKGSKAVSASLRIVGQGCDTGISYESHLRLGREWLYLGRKAEVTKKGQKDHRVRRIEMQREEWEENGIGCREK